jgi:hypothetical protein
MQDYQNAILYVVACFTTYGKSRYRYAVLCLSINYQGVKMSSLFLAK